MSHLKLTKISGHGLIFVAITNKLKNKDFAKQLIIVHIMIQTPAAALSSIVPCWGVVFCRLCTAERCLDSPALKCGHPSLQPTERRYVRTRDELWRKDLRWKHIFRGAKLLYWKWIIQAGHFYTEETIWHYNVQ